MRRDNDRTIAMERIGGHLDPLGAYEEERLLRHPERTALEVRILQRARSLPQLQLYWKRLDLLIESGAARLWPNSEKLSDEIKRKLGYVTPTVTLDGKLRLEVDSIALNRMKSDIFNVYFEQAMQLIAERFGVNPDDL